MNKIQWRQIARATPIRFSGGIAFSPRARRARLRILKVGGVEAVCGELRILGEISNSPHTGRALFVPADFARRGIALQFGQWAALTYEPAAPYRYEPHLSILDVLMWLPPETVRAALKTNLTLLSV